LEGKAAGNSMREREILLEVSHPYILNMHYSFHTSKRLYYILDFVNGGDLFGFIKKNGHLSEKEARYYGA
jgi:serine/threonine protein kinase